MIREILNSKTKPTPPRNRPSDSGRPLQFTGGYEGEREKKSYQPQPAPYGDRGVQPSRFNNNIQAKPSLNNAYLGEDTTLMEDSGILPYGSDELIRAILKEDHHLKYDTIAKEVEAVPDEVDYRIKEKRMSQAKFKDHVEFSNSPTKRSTRRTIEPERRTIEAESRYEPEREVRSGYKSDLAQSGFISEWPGEKITRYETRDQNVYQAGYSSRFSNSGSGVKQESKLRELAKPYADESEDDEDDTNMCGICVSKRRVKKEENLHK